MGQLGFCVNDNKVKFWNIVSWRNLLLLQFYLRISASCLYGIPETLFHYLCWVRLFVIYLKQCFTLHLFIGCILLHYLPWFLFLFHLKHCFNKNMNYYYSIKCYKIMLSIVGCWILTCAISCYFYKWLPQCFTCHIIIAQIGCIDLQPLNNKYWSIRVWVERSLW